MSMSDTRDTSRRMLIDVNEACSLLGVKRTFLFSLLASGRLRSVKLGRLRRIARADLEEYVEQLRSGGPGE